MYMYCMYISIIYIYLYMFNVQLYESYSFTLLPYY